MPQQFRKEIDGLIKNGAGSNFWTADQEGDITRRNVLQF